jgi:hypothetical protein
LCKFALKCIFAIEKDLVENCGIVYCRKEKNIRVGAMKESLHRKHRKEGRGNHRESRKRKFSK